MITQDRTFKKYWIISRNVNQDRIKKKTEQDLDLKKCHSRSELEKCTQDGIKQNMLFKTGFKQKKFHSRPD